MTTISHYLELNGKRYLLSDTNHLLDLTSWDHQIRDYIAEKLNLKLSNDHITVIELIRDSYKTRGKHPFVRVVTADMAKKIGPDRGTMRYFYNLFPKGIHQAFQIAGLPMQGFCF
ncbi:MAG: TusE/DsrC/DsvC family sulfur relay protein [Proteobacteria bacterium]|nr:TusE/DsrC/DsvC family sulfur relay protein [Pseudomonadota bacterium]